MRVSGELLLHLLGEQAPLGGELNLELSLPPSGETPLYVAEVKDWRLDLPWVRGVFQGRAFVRFVDDKVRLERFFLESESAVFRYQERELGATPLEFSGQAEKRLGGREWSLTHVRLVVGEALSLQGRARYSPTLGLEANLAGEVPQARALQQLFTAFLPGVLLNAGSAGKLGVACSISPLPSQGETQGRSRIEATLQPRGLILWAREGAGALSGLARLNAVLGEDAAPLSWSLESHFTLPGGVLFKGARLALSLQGERSTARIRQCFLRPLDESADKTVRLGGSLAWSASGASWSDLRVEADGLGNLDGGFELEDDTLQGALRGKGLNFAGALSWAERLLKTSLPDVKPKGSLECSLKLDGERDAPHVSAELGARGLAWATPDGNFLAEGLALDIDADTVFGEKSRLDVNLKAPAGGVLYKTLYLDLKVHPASMTLQGALEKEATLRIEALRAGLEGLGSILASGSLKPGPALGYDMRLAASHLDLGTLFKRFVQEPLSASIPALAKLKISGGGDLELQAKGSGARASLRGRLDLIEVACDTGKDGLKIENLGLSLPFDYELGRKVGTRAGARHKESPLHLQWGVDKTAAAEQAPAGVAAGELSAGRIGTPLGELKGLHMPVWLSSNELGLAGALEFSLYGGALQLKHIRVQEPLSKEFLLTCLARLQRTDLARIKTGSLPLQGFLAGDLGKVRLSREKLTVGGSLQGEFYGGKLHVGDISVHNPLSAGRGVMASAKVGRMHLERFSQALDLGEVMGRLDIDLKDFEMAYNQPVAFRLTMQSVPEDGVDQTISLKAVNAISVMGTGQGLTGLGVGMFATFFKTFSYQAIGFACDLENDVFRVKGLIKQGGVEYLIKKPPLFGINVINANPDNRISFSDMQERLERVLKPGDMEISTAFTGTRSPNHE